MIRNKSPLSTRWVDVWKVNAYGTKTMKNRLVIKGYLEDTTKLHTYSPNIGREVVILCLNVIVHHAWTTHTLDVKQAFLQSDDMKREVYVVPPKEAELGDHLMWKLRMAVYGLSDASRSWYLTARRILEEIGLFESKIESSLFFSVNDQGHLDGILAMHVDDLLYGGTEQFLSKMEVFKSKVVVGNTQSQSVTFKECKELWAGSLHQRGRQHSPLRERKAIREKADSKRGDESDRHN